MKDFPVLEGCEDFTLGSGPVGAVLIHGFTGSPEGMRELGEHLAANGVAVSAPRLAGHGTAWEDLATQRAENWVASAEAALDEMTRDRDKVFLVGLSFGGAVSLHLAAEHPDRVAGVVTLATFLGSKDPRRFVAPVFSRVIKTIPGAGNDIADPEGHEIAYEKVPTRASTYMLRFVRRVRAELSQVRCPLLIIHSPNDHVAYPGAAELIMARAGSSDKELIWLERSYHVITKDYERQDVYEKTLQFIKKHSGDDRV